MEVYTAGALVLLGGAVLAMGVFAVRMIRLLAACARSPGDASSGPRAAIQPILDAAPQFGSPEEGRTMSRYLGVTVRALGSLELRSGASGGGEPSSPRTHFLTRTSGGAQLLLVLAELWPRPEAPRYDRRVRVPLALRAAACARLRQMLASAEADGGGDRSAWMTGRSPAPAGLEAPARSASG